jgi:hypothetical protein
MAIFSRDFGARIKFLVLPDLCDTLLERNRHGLMHAVQVTSLHKVWFPYTQGMVGSTGG